MKNMLMAGLATALLFLAGTALAVTPTDRVSDASLEASQSAASEAGVPATPIETALARYGTVVDKQLVGVGGLTAWTIEKNGKRVVLYSTTDAAVLFTGIVWDTATGQNISDRFRPTAGALPGGAGQSAVEAVPASGSSAVAPPVSTVAAMDGSYGGDLPESIATVDELAGFKEGTGGPADTVYIIFDPRCPYCRAAYRQTRGYVAQGHTIKWIPAIALGNPDEGIPLAATVLQSNDADVMQRVLGGHESITSQATPATIEHLTTNFDFLLAAFEQNGGTPGVPAAFFLDHRTGTPKMMTGVSEAMILQDIFGDLK